LRRPRPGRVNACPRLPGRRKRPHPAQPFPRHYKGRYLGGSIGAVGAGAVGMWRGGPWAAQERGSRQGNGQRGRRKRPHPAHPPPPPLRIRSGSPGAVPLYLPLKAPSPPLRVRGLFCITCSIQIWSRERGRPRGSPPPFRTSPAPTGTRPLLKPICTFRGGSC
jgi:hypothetical protein